MKIVVMRLIRGEKGQALVLVLILLVVGGLVIAPLLDFMGTGLKVGEGVYEEKMYEIYAADAGIEDGLCQIKYDGMDDFDGYDEYDYSSNWTYSLNESVNGYNVYVAIKNVWMPKDIPAPNAVTARQIIEEGNMLIAGSPSITEESTYEIKMSYQRECGDDLFVETIGIWLPPGFKYNDNCSLEGEDFYSEPQTVAYKGGYAVVWSFTSVRFEDFPGGSITESLIIKSLTFEYTGPDGQLPDSAVSWIDTSGVDIGADTYTWDADINIYKILSVAGDCEVEAYTARMEMRKLGAAIAGDYHAIGSTLMTCAGSYCPYYRNRLFKESSATIDEGDIPPTATIEAAWLYWSGWIESAEPQGPWPPETCDNMNDWIPGDHWTLWSWYGDKEFLGQGGGSDEDRTLTMHVNDNPTHCLDLSPYSGQEVTVSWSQREWQSGWGWQELESYDCLKYGFSGDGGGSWSMNFTAFCDDDPSISFSIPIPDEYLTDRFQMRFFLYFDEFNEYCYIDDITITVPSQGSSLEDAKVNRVRFGTTGNMTAINASQWQVAPTPDSGAPDSWSYSCYYDATQIAHAVLDPDTKSGTFTLGHVLEGSGYNLHPIGTTGYPLATPASCTGFGCVQYQWTYAGWSLIIIYASSETEGHQLYLFDTFRYVGRDTLLEFSVSNFLAPDNPTGSHLTYFVGEGDDHYDGDSIEVNGNPLSDPPDNPWNNIFNSYSNTIDDPVFKSGIDIDTFDMSAYVNPGDTSAEVILDSGEEIYDLVYIILSFRSDTTSGGSISYLIRG